MCLCDKTGCIKKRCMSVQAERGVGVCDNKGCRCMVRRGVGVCGKEGCRCV